MTPTVVQVLLLVKGSDFVGDCGLGLCRGVCVIVCVFISEFPAVIEICPDYSDQSDEPFLTVACLLGVLQPVVFM